MTDSKQRTSTSSIPVGTPLGAALQRLSAGPYGRNSLDLVSAVATEVVSAMQAGKIEDPAAAVAALVDLEAEAPDEQSRRGYGIALRRVLSDQNLRRWAALLLDPLYGNEARIILTRAGIDGTNILLKHLIDAPTIAERRTYFDALRGSSEGTHLAIRLLQDDQWFVVRNMAELLGELRLEDAVPALGKALSHSDARVRVSAAGALAKIGTAATVEYLRRALKNGDRETRLVVSRSIEGRQSAALAMPLVLAAEDEEDLELKQEYYLALGRIGTPDAVQALIKALPPGGRFMGRKPSGPRVAAVKALRTAGGQAVRGALEGLKKDPDKSVRAAAAEALEELSAS